MVRPGFAHVKSSRGYSLVELLVALVIFTIIMVGILSMALTAIRGNAASQRLTEGRLLAQGKLETLLNTPVDTLINLDACPGDADPRSDLVCTYECAPENCEFYRVLEPEDPEKPDHVWITIKSQAHNFSLKTLVRE